MTAVLIAALLGLCAPAEEACAIDDTSAGGLIWSDGNYNAALSAAREADVHVFLAFLPEWSDYSNRLRDEVLTDGSVAAALEGLVCVDVDPDDPRGAQVARLHAVTAFPALVVLGSDGRVEDRIDGFIPAGPLVGELARILSGTGTVSDARARADAAPDDLDLRAALADKLGNVGQAREAERLLDTIRRDDPEGATLAGARVLITDASNRMVADAGDGGAASYDLASLRDAIRSVTNARARFEGLTRLADVARLAGRDDEVLPVFREAWDDVPPEFVLDWGLDLAGLLDERSGQLDAEGLAFYLEVAQAVADRAEAVGDGTGGAVDGALPPGTDYGPWLARRLDALAFAARANGDVDRAVALAARCLELEPGNPEYENRAAFFLGER